MEDIDLIHKNDFGIAFWWKRCAIENYQKINFVFGKTALHLNESETLVFVQQIDISLSRLVENMHKNYTEKLMFVETPIPQLSFTMDYEDLISLQNLVEGTLVELGIDAVLNKGKKILI